MSGKTCLNCGHKTHGKFCSNCGQKTDTHRIDWHYVWHDLPHSFLHVDKGILYTFKQLTIRPGHAINEFLDGKRAVHFRPLMYMIITGTITGLIYISLPEHSLFAQDQETLNFVTELSRFQGKYFNLITVGFTPLTALLAWFFYRKHRNYVEILISLFFITGHTNLISLLSLVTFPFGNLYLTSVVSMIGGVAAIGFFVFSFFQQYQKLSTVKRIVYPLIIGIVNSLLLFIITLTIFLRYMVLSGKGSGFNLHYSI
ncbi:MAG: DUF3667 domain-containing protein [Flavobacteriales bacterium]